MTKELLEKYGITAEVTAENQEEIQTQLEAAILEKHKNDPKFYETLDPNKAPQDWYNAKFKESKLAEMNETIKLIGKHYSFTSEEQSKFTPEELADKGKYIQKAHSILMGRDNSQAQISKIQKDFADREEKLTNELTELRTNSEKKEKEGEEKLNQYKIDMAVMTASQKLDKNLLVKPHTGVGIMLPKLKEKYAVVIEGNKVVLKNKENPALRVLIEGTNKDLPIETAIEQIYKEEEIWKEIGNEQEHSTKGKTVFTPNGDPAPFNQEELDQIAREKSLGFTEAK